MVLRPLKVNSEVNSVSHSPDGIKLTAGTNKHIIIWNIETGEELLKTVQRAWRVAFTPDGLRLVSGNLKDIRISDVATGDIIKQFDAHCQKLSPTNHRSQWFQIGYHFLQHDDAVLRPDHFRTHRFFQQETISDSPSQDDELLSRFFDHVHTNYPPRRSNHLPYGVLQRSAPVSHHDLSQLSIISQAITASTPCSRTSPPPHKIAQFLQQHVPFVGQYPAQASHELSMSQLHMRVFAISMPITRKSMTFDVLDKSLGRMTRRKATQHL
ncbi:hypothetical protein BD769DRAFT_1668034 [Suillus cothurnatus]|nr:hypothetical protein BD769DRAFT_1668034 [Suillus cothurnatus]